MNLTWLAALLPFLLAILVFGLALGAFRRRSIAGGAVQLLTGLLLLSVSLLLVLVALGMHGYQAFTAEQTAATVRVERTGPQQFTAHFELPDESSRTFELTGDELYVDARILKWDPRANLLGLQTGYQLDRVAGRYQLLDDEQTSERTVFQLGEDAPVDLFAAVRRFPFLRGLVDAEYGSATFLPVESGQRYQVRVSNSGLLIRELP